MQLVLDSVVLRNDRSFARRVKPQLRSPGDQTSLIVLLVIILVCAVFLLLVGEHCARVAVFIIAFLTTSIIMLYLLQQMFAYNGTRIGFFPCVFPITISAFVSCEISAVHLA